MIAFPVLNMRTLLKSNSKCHVCHQNIEKLSNKKVEFMEFITIFSEGNRMHLYVKQQQGIGSVCHHHGNQFLKKRFCLTGDLVI